MDLSTISKTDAAVVTQQDFDAVREMAHEKFGLDLKPGKEDLVSARLGRLLRESKCSTFREFCRQVREDSTGESLIAMIDALTTNHTSFFRETEHFRFLREQLIPEMKPRDGTAIWSAACSSGEEPYSIAFTLYENLQPYEWSRVSILGTDVSTRMLAKCQDATYPERSLEAMADPLKRRCFLKGWGVNAGMFRIKEEVRKRVQFSRLNLIENYSPPGRFFLVLCRNVMIYFDRPTQQKVVDRLISTIEPGGYLFIGHAESLNGIQHDLKYVRPSIYRK